MYLQALLEEIQTKVHLHHYLPYCYLRCYCCCCTEDEELDVDSSVETGSNCCYIAVVEGGTRTVVVVVRK